MRKSCLALFLLASTSFVAKADYFYTLLDGTNPANIVEFKLQDFLTVPTITFPPPNGTVVPLAGATYVPASASAMCGGGVFTCILGTDGTYFWNWSNPSLGLSVQLLEEEMVQGVNATAGYTAVFGDVDLSVPGVYEALQTPVTLTISTTGFVLTDGNIPEPSALWLVFIAAVCLLGISRFRFLRRHA